ncbi:MAG: hypothetical protein UV40_C0043G0003 [Parcubacteria group bacterium GW2011_GWA1_42_7]|nr:MAG: hypothetical protein UV40_C0043G0003 [Parcubacteria group bacterium GW2011_GWA1_42_7]
MKKFFTITAWAILLSIVPNSSFASFAANEESSYESPRNGVEIGIKVVEKTGSEAIIEMTFKCPATATDNGFRLGFHVRRSSIPVIPKEITPHHALYIGQGINEEGSSFSLFNQLNGSMIYWCSTGQGEAKVRWKVKGEADLSTFLVTFDEVSRKISPFLDWALIEDPFFDFKFTITSPSDLSRNGKHFEMEDVYLLFKYYFDLGNEGFAPERLNILCDVDENGIFAKKDLDLAVKVFFSDSKNTYDSGSFKISAISWEDLLLEKYPAEAQSIRAFVKMLKSNRSIRSGKPPQPFQSFNHDRFYSGKIRRDYDRGIQYFRAEGCHARRWIQIGGQALNRLECKEFLFRNILLCDPARE